MSHFELNDDRADCIDFDAIFADPPAPEPLTQAQVNDCLARWRSTDPAGYLALGVYVNCFAKGVTQTQAYKHVEGAGKAIRRTLHETEVI